jgi:hypothetical protein
MRWSFCAKHLHFSTIIFNICIFELFSFDFNNYITICKGVLVNVKHNETFTNVHKTDGGVSVTVVVPVSATNYLCKNGELTSHLVH